MQNAIEEAMSRAQLLKESTMRKRAEREAQTMEATRQLHIKAGRDPDKALEPCSKEEFEAINAHAQMVSKYHRKQAEELQAKKYEEAAEEAAYEKYKADLARYKTGPKK